MDQTRQLFAVFVLPPVTWAAHLQMTYALHQQTCASQSRTMLWIISLVAVAAIAGNAWLSRSLMRKSRRDIDRFMAIAALLLSLFFLLLVVGQTIPQFMRAPCE